MLNNEEANKLLDDIFNKATAQKKAEVPQEALKNPMSVGSVGHGFSNNHSFYQPHNFRRWYDFDKSSFKSPVSGWRPINSTELFFPDWNGCNLKIKKNTIEITNKIDHKKVYAIDLTTRESIVSQLQAIWDKKEKECIHTLKLFISAFGGHSDYIQMNKKSENKVMEDEITKLLDPKLQWHTKTSKKVYEQQSIEFFDEITASNYVDNAALKKFSPEIENRLEAVLTMQENFFNTFLPVHQEHAVNIRTHTAVLKGIDQSFKKFNTLLGERQRKEREEKAQTSLGRFL